MPHEATAVRTNPRLVALIRRKDRVSHVLTLLTMVAYFGFIGLLAFNPHVLAQRVSNGVNVGIPIGIGVIIWCWLLTGWYVRWANTAYDDEVAAVTAQLLLGGATAEVPAEAPEESA